MIIPRQDSHPTRSPSNQEGIILLQLLQFRPKPKHFLIFRILISYLRACSPEETPLV